MARRQIHGRVGKKCWAWERRRDLRERRRQRRSPRLGMYRRRLLRSVVLRATLRAAERKRNEHGRGADFAGWQYFERGSGAVAQTAAGEAAELAEIHGKLLRTVARCETDVWQSRPLPFLAAVFSFAGRRAASAGGRGDHGGPGRARNRCGDEGYGPTRTIPFA